LVLLEWVSRVFPAINPTTNDITMHSLNLNWRVGAFLFLGYVCGGAVYGQLPGAPASIHATGQHELELEPQKLRLMLAIRAEGADAKSAIESLLDHKERVKSELLAMKAEEASIDFGATQLSSGVPGMPAEMMRYGPRMIAQVTAASNGDAAEIPKVYIAVSRVRADWPLPITDADALAVLPETLKEQVKERDLMGEKNKAQLDGQQQEKLEELQAAMQENMGYYSGTEDASPITVMFVAKIDEETRKQAVKAAYDRAMTQAKMLSSVTGKALGNLKMLRTGDVPVPATDEIESTYAQAYAAYASYAPGPISSVAVDEALSASPRSLKLVVRVEAEFALAE
jgi:uncharacterized protein YggE